ncbi:MAG TPA: hypothetical protein VNG71_01955 [Pyrinomonadaceae bacterium]|nr:hypothetical protein [Pyrinomonadaceae bacterium]
MPKRKCLTVLLLVVFLAPITLCQEQPAAELLTNEKVLALVRAGLPPAIVISKIRVSQTNFNTSTDELIRLQQAKVPPEIINAMVEATSTVSTAKATTGAGDSSRIDSDDPLAAHEAGIYLYEEIEGRKRMTQLEPSVSKQTKTGGVFTSAMTGGLTKIKFKAALAGSSAALQIGSLRPVFYFYFEVKNSGLSSNSYYATSPTNSYSLLWTPGAALGK